MRSLLDVTGLKVFSAKGRKVGRVFDVLFAPSGARVIGFVVERPRLLGMLDRKPLYLALDRCRTADKRIDVAAGRDAWGRQAARRTGLDWDTSVIWMGMPVVTESGERLGVVRDGWFDPDGGAVARIGLTGGITADIAVGVREIPVTLVRGFDGTAVVVGDEAALIDTSGGAASAAGKGAAIARQAGSEAAKKAVAAGKTAAAYGASAVRVAAGSEAGKKAAGWLKALKDEVVDAMGDPDDE